MKSVRIEPGTPATARNFYGARMWFSIRSEDSDGRLAMQRSEVPPGSRTALHYHTREDEAFYITAGRVFLRTATETLHLDEGDLVLLPPGAVHQLGNDSDHNAEILTFMSPGALENAFLQLCDVSGSQTMRETFSRHGVVFLKEGDPLPHRPDRRVIVRRKGHVRAVMFGPDRYEVLLTQDETEGRFAILRIHVAPGGGAPLHIHRNEDEYYQMLSGRVVLRGSSSESASAGATVILPGRLPHAFSNPGTERASFLAIVSPGGFEEFLLRIGKVPGAPGSDTLGPEDLQRLVEQAPRFGLELLPE